METPQSSLYCAYAAHDGRPIKEEKGAEEAQRTITAAVDPFLVEALENPRHRLTVWLVSRLSLYTKKILGCDRTVIHQEILGCDGLLCILWNVVLRMELDIQRFMQNSDQHQFEFQHLPTSYLRCAAHRVAQHYGLQTLALDNAMDGFTSRVIARKTPESRYPATCLSDIPMKQPESGKTEPVKFVIRPRPNQASLCDATETGSGRRLLRTVEERKEEYDKARARIFSAPSSPEVKGPSSMVATDVRSLCSNRDEPEYDKIVPNVDEHEKIGMKDAASTIAIFRDREKDLSDPDYNRSYDRYARGLVPCHDFNLGACNALRPSYLQYEPGIPQFSQFPQTHTSVSYMPSSSMAPICAVGCNQTSPDGVYMQWPTPAMVYANSYGHFRHAIYPAPVYQQPLSFEHWQNR